MKDDLDLWLATICLIGRCYPPDEVVEVFGKNEEARGWWMLEAARLTGWS